jgi:hypothetical protein
MLSVIMLSVIMLSVIMLSVIMLSVIMLSVVMLGCRYAECRYAQCLLYWVSWHPSLTAIEIQRNPDQSSQSFWRQNFDRLFLQKPVKKMCQFFCHFV